MTAPTSTPTPAGFPDRLVAFALGLALFMVMDVVVLLALGGRGSLAAGLAFAALTAAGGVLLYRSGRHWHGAGVAVGFALMTVVTGGVCTVFRPMQEGAFGGLLYLVITVLALIVAGIARSVTHRERAP